MTRLVITAIGPASSVQDGGRPGSQRYGLTPGGAIDPLALVAANALVGNTPFAPAIEIGPFGATFAAQGGAVCVSLTGASRPASIGSRQIAMNRSMTLQDGEAIKLGFARDGVFSYLGIAGGFEGTPMFGSFAVNARAGLGSPYPRPLQSADIIDLVGSHLRDDQMIELPPTPDGPIRVVLGPQNDEFDDAMIALFLDSDWAISATSDRMGYRLEGPAIKHKHGHNIVSDGTVNGSIQVPGNGAPIVLMPDRGTSGGYPKIATVITADLGRLAQTPAGRAFRFKAVTMDQAQTEARSFAALLRSLSGRVQPYRSGGFNLDALQNANVAGAAVNAIDASSWQSHSEPQLDGIP